MPKTAALLISSLIAVVAAPVSAAPIEVLSCTVESSKGYQQFPVGHVIVHALDAFETSPDAMNLILKQQKQDTQFIVSRKTGEFAYTITPRWTDTRGTCVRSTQEVKF